MDIVSYLQHANFVKGASNSTYMAQMFHRSMPANFAYVVYQNN